MNYFLDTEFIEDGSIVDLISIGIVAEDGQQYYACNDYCDLSRAGDWVQQNVIPHLPSKHSHINPGNPDVSPQIRQDILTWKDPDLIAKEIIEFVGNDPKPVFWGYYADYDWVVFCQLWGTMMDLPKGFPMYCRDLQQECDRLGVTASSIAAQPDNEHNALSDALWNCKLWTELQKLNATL